jgi:hypothetical protein
MAAFIWLLGTQELQAARLMHGQTVPGAYELFDRTGRPMGLVVGDRGPGWRWRGPSDPVSPDATTTRSARAGARAVAADRMRLRRYAVVRGPRGLVLVVSER